MPVTNINVQQSHFGNVRKREYGWNKLQWARGTCSRTLDDSENMFLIDFGPMWNFGKSSKHHENPKSKTYIPFGFPTAKRTLFFTKKQNVHVFLIPKTKRTLILGFQKQNVRYGGVTPGLAVRAPQELIKVSPSKVYLSL